MFSGTIEGHAAGCGCGGCCELTENAGSRSWFAEVGTFKGPHHTHGTGLEAFNTNGGKWGPSGALGTTGGTVTWSLPGAGLADATRGNFFQGRTVDFSTVVNFDFEAVIQRALDAWAAVADITFVQVNDNRQAIGVGTQADIRIVAGLIDGNGNGFGNTLAQAWLPEPGGTAAQSPRSGDLVVDSGQVWTEAQFFRVVLHELGHSLGLLHTGERAIMQAFDDPSLSRLMPDDIAGVRRIYGEQDGGGGDATSDDFLANRQTTGRVAVDGRARGDIETAGDTDWFRIELEAGATYKFDVIGGALEDPTVRLRDGTGTSVGYDDDSRGGLDPSLTFTATRSGAHYIEVGGYQTNTGTYTVDVDEVSPAPGGGGGGGSPARPTAGNDRLSGTDGADRINLLAGDDRYDGRGGNDTIYGGAGNDIVQGGAGNDRVYGDAGRDTLNGGSGDDIVRGGDGNDTLSGSDGNDRMWGDAGNDTFLGGNGNNILYGGAGFDTARIAAGFDAMTFGANATGTFVYDRFGRDTLVAVERMLFDDGVDGRLGGSAATPTVTFTDPNGAYDWDRKLMVLDADGSKPWSGVVRDYVGTQEVRRTIVEDDGDQTVFTYSDGVRTDVQNVDGSNTQSWDTVHYAYGDDGVIDTRVTRLDNGDVATIHYSDGDVVTRTLFDGSDSRDWQIAVSSYDGNGDLISQVFS